MVQQALERMNVKFHDVISDLTGVSGLKVIGAILNGVRQPELLLALCDVQIQKKKADAVKESLRGTWKTEHLFALRQALEVWEFYQKKIAECDQQLAAVFRQIAGPEDPQAPAPPAAKRGGLNAPDVENLHGLLCRLCGGKDPTTLPGVADYTLLQLISEVGTDLSVWKTEKHFTAWLGLAPGSKQSGKRKGNQKRARNRAGRLFCVVARTVGRSVDKALGGFYRRLKVPPRWTGRQRGLGPKIGGVVLVADGAWDELRRRRPQKT